MTNILNISTKFFYFLSIGGTENSDDLFQFFILLFFIIVPAASVVYLLTNNEYWKRGKIPPWYGYRKGNIVTVLFHLGYNFQILEKASPKEKRMFMASYLKQNYPDANFHVSGGLLMAKNHPLKNSKIADWFCKNLTSESDRSNILYFATGICWADGRLNKRENEKLKKFCLSLNLDLKFLSEINSMYEAKFIREHQKIEEERRQERQEDFRQTSASNSRSGSINSIYFKILGLEETSNFDEVKKAYRSLAKIHHPDMQSNKTGLEKSIAEQKFIEIKHAYDILEDLLNK